MYDVSRKELSLATVDTGGAGGTSRAGDAGDSGYLHKNSAPMLPPTKLSSHSIFLFYKSDIGLDLVTS